MPLTTVPLLSLFAAQQAQTLRDKLCATLRQLIAHGTLQKGERLPSSRLLATDLSLSRVTVEAAYAQLESEGYLLRKIGKGTFVAIALPADRRVKKIPRTSFPILSSRGQQIVATGGCQDPLFSQALPLVRQIYGLFLMTYGVACSVNAFAIQRKNSWGMAIRRD